MRFEEREQWGILRDQYGNVCEDTAGEPLRRSRQTGHRPEFDGVVTLSREEMEALPEFSRSRPPSYHKGFVWKRNKSVKRLMGRWIEIGPPVWHVGLGYGRDGAAMKCGWYRPIIEEDADQHEHERETVSTDEDRDGVDARVRGAADQEGPDTD